MNILLLGKNGQVGWELQRSLAPLGRLTALGRHGEGDLCGDLGNLEGLAATVRALRPDIIVNAAAHVAVDEVESEPDQAWRINAAAPAVLAHEAWARGALLVHYSTDYVFDGGGTRPWREDDMPAPLNHYGRTKLAGEQAIVQSGCRHLILRTSWVYAARGRNFIRTMLRLARGREDLAVVDDQWGAPTGAELVADVSAHAIMQVCAQPAKAGLYHLAAAGETCWRDYARHLLHHAARLRPDLPLAAREVAGVATRDYPTPARRPLNSRLDTQRLQAAFGLVLPPWQDGVDRVLAEILLNPP